MAVAGAEKVRILVHPRERPESAVAAVVPQDSGPKGPAQLRFLAADPRERQLLLELAGRADKVPPEMVGRLNLAEPEAEPEETVQAVRRGWEVPLFTGQAAGAAVVELPRAVPFRLGHPVVEVIFTWPAAAHQVVKPPEPLAVMELPQEPEQCAAAAAAAEPRIPEPGSVGKAEMEVFPAEAEAEAGQRRREQPAEPVEPAAQAA